MSQDKILSRIAGLLAKAEATEFGPEAETLIAKAQQLSTLYEIDLERAWAARGTRPPQQLTQRKIELWPQNKRGGKYQVMLFGAVAASSEIEYNISHYSDYVNAFGYPDDIDRAERLWASLSVQMVSAANAALKRGEHKSAGIFAEPVDARVWRGSFYTGFCATIRQRLSQARQQAIAASDAGITAEQAADSDELDAAGTTTRAEGAADGATGAAALVLASKADTVAEFYRTNSNAKGRWKAPKRTGTSNAAVRAGQRAARNARIGHTSELRGPSTPIAG